MQIYTGEKKLQRKQSDMLTSLKAFPSISAYADSSHQKTIPNGKNKGNDCVAKTAWVLQEFANERKKKNDYILEDDIGTKEQESESEVEEKDLKEIGVTVWTDENVEPVFSQGPKQEFSEIDDEKSDGIIQNILSNDEPDQDFEQYSNKSKKLVEEQHKIKRVEELKTSEIIGVVEIQGKKSVQNDIVPQKNLRYEDVNQLNIKASWENSPHQKLREALHIEDINQMTILRKPILKNEAEVQAQPLVTEKISPEVSDKKSIVVESREQSEIMIAKAENKQLEKIEEKGKIVEEPAKKQDNERKNIEFEKKKIVEESHENITRATNLQIENIAKEKENIIEDIENIQDREEDNNEQKKGKYVEESHENNAKDKVEVTLITVKPTENTAEAKVKIIVETTKKQEIKGENMETLKKNDEDNAEVKVEAINKPTENIAEEKVKIIVESTKKQEIKREKVETEKNNTEDIAEVKVEATNQPTENIAKEKITEEPANMQGKEENNNEKRNGNYVEKKIHEDNAEEIKNQPTENIAEGKPMILKEPDNNTEEELESNKEQNENIYSEAELQVAENPMIEKEDNKIITQENKEAIALQQEEATHFLESKKKHIIKIQANYRRHKTRKEYLKRNKKKIKLLFRSLYKSPQFTYVAVFISLGDNRIRIIILDINKKKVIHKQEGEVKNLGKKEISNKWEEIVKHTEGNVENDCAEFFKEPPKEEQEEYDDINAEPKLSQIEQEEIEVAQEEICAKMIQGWRRRKVRRLSKVPMNIKKPKIIYQTCKKLAVKHANKSLPPSTVYVKLMFLLASDSTEIILKSINLSTRVSYQPTFKIREKALNAEYRELVHEVRRIHDLIDVYMA